MNACILIRVLPGKNQAVLEAVKKFPQVKSASIVLGRHDVVAFAEAPTYEDLSTPSNKVHAIPETKKACELFNSLSKSKPACNSGSPVLASSALVSEEP